MYIVSDDAVSVSVTKVSVAQLHTLAVGIMRRRVGEYVFLKPWAEDEILFHEYLAEYEGKQCTVTAYVFAVR